MPLNNLDQMAVLSFHIVRLAVGKPHLIDVKPLLVIEHEVNRDVYSEY